jgi:hypothetical protein
VSRDVSSIGLDAELGSGFSRFGAVSGIAKGPQEGDQLPEHVQGDFLGDCRIPRLGWAKRQQDAALWTRGWLIRKLGVGRSRLAIGTGRRHQGSGTCWRGVDGAVDPELL